MDTNTANVLLATVPAAISALVTWAVTFFSMRDNRQQQWRERKIQAYADVVRAISLLHSYETEHKAEMEGQTKLPHTYKNHIENQFADAMEILRHQRGAGGFLLTPVAAIAVTKLVSHLDILGGDPTPDGCAGSLKAIDKAKYVVLKEAARDLNVDFPT